MSDQPLSERLTALADERTAWRESMTFFVDGPGQSLGPGIGTVEAWRNDLRALAAEVARLEADRDALRAAVDRVRALHREVGYVGGDNDSRICAACVSDYTLGDEEDERGAWPCPTIRALDTTEAGDG